MSNLNQCDWDELNEQWSKAVVDQLVNTKHKPINPLNKNARGFDYLYIEYATNRATFYVINEDDGKLGFWVPNSAIVLDTGSIVSVANWCQLTDIIFK